MVTGRHRHALPWAEEPDSGWGAWVDGEAGSLLLSLNLLRSRNSLRSVFGDKEAPACVKWLSLQFLNEAELGFERTRNQARKFQESNRGKQNPVYLCLRRPEEKLLIIS